MLDLEDGHAGPELVEWARAFNHAVHAELGVFPLFYSYASYIAAMRPAKPIGTGLWLASYGRNDGRDHGAAVPKPWRHYLLHQFSSRCRVQGCAGLVDLSHAPYGLKPLLTATHRHRKG
jgi:GH25 family lysozyme M1 (1,4-beta-N-acetylmuramidase)